MEEASSTTTRPRSVTLTLIGVFLLGVWNVGKALAYRHEMALQLELAVQPDPRFRFIMAIIWMGVFLGLWWLVRKKRPFTRKLLPLMLVLYAGYELGLKALFAQNELARQSIWLNLIFYLVIIVFMTWALNRTAANNYFHNNTEARQTSTPEG